MTAKSIYLPQNGLPHTSHVSAVKALNKVQAEHCFISSGA